MEETFSRFDIESEGSIVVLRKLRFCSSGVCCLNKDVRYIRLREISGRTSACWLEELCMNWWQIGGSGPGSDSESHGPDAEGCAD